MVDIFSIPVFYISFQKNDRLETHLEKVGFKDVNHTISVDGKKLSITDLSKRKLISPRVYNDVEYGRRQYSGIPTKGGIGCTLSHFYLWKTCISKNLPYIIVAEDDLKLDVLDYETIAIIQDFLKTPKSLFVGVDVDKSYKGASFGGTQFYIASKKACESLVKFCFPIDIQTDWYISFLDKIGEIEISGLPISTQIDHTSSIQDICVTCFLNETDFGIFIVIAIVLLLYILYRRFIL